MAQNTPADYIKHRIASLETPPTSAKKQFAIDELHAVLKRFSEPELVRPSDPTLAVLRDVRDYLDSHGNGWDEADLLDRVRAAIAAIEAIPSPQQQEMK